MIDLAALQLTRKRMTTGIWLCAALTMVASAISGVTSFYQLQHDNWGIAAGGATALAVDIALWVVLTGDHQLELIGLSSGRWGRIMRVGTCLASILLNCTAAWLSGHPMLVVLHAVIPLLLVGLAEYNSVCAARFTSAEVGAREALASKEDAARLADTPVTRPSERIYDQPAELPAPDLQRTLGPGAPLTTVTPFAYTPARPRLRTADQRKWDAVKPSQNADLRKQSYSKPAARSPLQVSTPVRDQAFAWLDQHHGPDTTASKLATAINGSPHTCKKLLGEWRRANNAPKEAVS
jgi:hypothetical protein